jgi:hypothetical protein
VSILWFALFRHLELGDVHSSELIVQLAEHLLS